MTRCELKPDAWLLMLEDDPDRVQRFQTVISRHFPEVRLRVWRDAHAMIREAEELLPAARLISLDHDLIPEPGDVDPGDGYQVVQWLVEQPIRLPVIIHTSNTPRAGWMSGAFELANWEIERVAPLGDDWIEADWRIVVHSILSVTS